MNLVEIVAFYSTLVLTEGREAANQYLRDNINPVLHSYIISCVSDQGVVINSRGGEFFFEDYHGVPRFSTPGGQ